ncbi:ABC transporter permease [Micromonospora vinacea]|uniref:ABC-type transport system involved in multi-copper enzyme maturation permease subunit n=1 Tax=Micromonospora vinacea TaxID=709878 RepID=A0ABS0KB09_9ACTN|nr:ABC transporter permease [Micromonospora vinacea]MBG6105823.1 ABC-type transport system involved in multi-copper enzyme maturation permease subunit [Micromonospora vinacea]WSZ78016.1 ABC transporter permease [Micromonospora sp. NBC_00860]WTA65552.1 ABC transporter permease [Micromonospora sp. NBC_00855]
MKITPGGVAAAEWTKFSSLRSTWITTGISALLLIAFGMIASASFSGDNLTSVDLALSGSALAALSVGVLGALLGASEYTTGMIRATLTAVPRRLPVLWSKSLVAGSAAFVTMTAGAFAAFASGSAVLNDKVAGLGLGDDGVLRALVGAGLYLGLVAVLGVALGMLVRSSAGAIAILSGLLLIVPGLAALLPDSISEAITPYLPSNAGSAVMALTQADGTLAPWAGLAVFAGYVIVTLAAAAYRLKRTDA